jgi:hypothetical protein
MCDENFNVDVYWEEKGFHVRINKLNYNEQTGEVELDTQIEEGYENTYTQEELQEFFQNFINSALEAQLEIMSLVDDGE